MSGKRGVPLRVKDACKVYVASKAQEFLLSATRWQPSGVWAPCLFERGHGGRWVISKVLADQGEGRWDHEPTMYELEVYAEHWLSTAAGQYYERAGSSGVEQE